jgi:hypothetical protein
MTIMTAIISELIAGTEKSPATCGEPQHEIIKADWGMEAR